MNIIERAVNFSCESEALIGVLSEPVAHRGVGVLIIVGGWQYRAGSHRQFVLLARRLAAQGFPALRFDCRGMGDSGGEMRNFEAIESDIRAAIDAFRSACPALERIVLWGLCDAASASLMYLNATADARVAGIVMLNPWVLSDESFARSQIRHHYLKRALQPDFWKKFLRGEVDLADPLRTLGAAMRSSTVTGRNRSGYQTIMAQGMAAHAGPVLIVLSAQDPTAKAFLEYCRTNECWQGLIDRPNVELHSVPDADHTFSSAAWRWVVECATLEWLERSFPGEPRASIR